jgi:hypothetical protein
MSSGPSTDRDNRDVIDPTDNVRFEIAAERRRQDDLRDMESRWRDKVDKIQIDHIWEMRHAESERLDAVRSVDQGNVQRAAEVQASQALALATQVVESAAVLAARVDTTATAFEAKLGATVAPLQTRIDDLTRVQYEGVGQKTQVVETRAGLSSANTLISIGLGALALLGVVYELSHSKASPSSPAQQIVCTATYHPAPCP